MMVPLSDLKELDRVRSLVGEDGRSQMTTEDASCIEVDPMLTHVRLTADKWRMAVHDELPEIVFLGQERLTDPEPGMIVRIR